jgi:hypothetical protein
MLLDVHLLDTKTGERAVYRDDYEWHDQPEYPAADTIEFLWGEGNYSCDCNRNIFFNIATGRTGDRACGDDRFTVEKIVERGTDRVLYSED